MINLIPPEGRSVTRLEYWARVFAVWFFLIGGVSLVAIFLRVPSYVLVTTNISTLDKEINSAHEDEVSFKEAESAIAKVNEIATQLLAKESSVVASQIIAEISDATNDGVVVNRFVLTTNTEIEDIKKQGKVSVLVQGKATTREALARFKTDLEKSPLFETASVPISDLARESELPFVVTLTLTNQAL